MVRARWIAVMGVAAVLLTAPGAVWAKPGGRLPQPDGASRWSDPTRMMMGSVPLRVQHCTVEMSVEDVLAFFHEALPKAGWHLGLLPWQRQQQAVLEKVEGAIQRAPETDQPALQARRHELAEGVQDLRRQIFATKGTDRLILNVESHGQTVIFANVWEGRNDAIESVAGAGPSGQWPATNVCCSGDAVPATVVHPLGLPHYPGAQTLVSSSAGQNGATVILVTPDTAGDVQAFYGKQLSYGGWRLEQDLGEQGSSRSWWYGDESRRLAVTIGQAEDAGKRQTMVLLSVVPRVQMPSWMRAK